MANDTQKLIHDAEVALHKASEVVEDTVASTKTTLRKADKELTRETGALQSGLESVLGGKSLFWVEEPVDGRRLAGNMAGWGTFGLAVHAWHRGVQRRPILGAPYRPYMLAFPLWSLLGYYIHHFELRQEEVVEHKRLLLKRNRGLLEEKDYQELSPSHSSREKKSQLLSWFSSSSPSAPKTFTREAEERPGHPMKARVQEIASKGHGEMEGYGRKLHEKLDAFEKEFAEQDPAKASAGATLKSASPYLSGSAPVPVEKKPARSLPSPHAAEQKGAEPKPTSSWGGLFGFGAKEDIKDEVETALR